MRNELMSRKFTVDADDRVKQLAKVIINYYEPKEDMNSLFFFNDFSPFFLKKFLNQTLLISTDHGHRVP